MTEKKYKRHYGLIVEDDQAIREMMADSLAQMEQIHFVVQTANGADAMLRMQNQTFHFAIIDLGLPRLSGLELIKRIRQEEKRSKRSPLPIIIISGNIENSTVREALGMNVKNILVKPFDVSEVEQKVREIFQQNGLNKIKKQTA